MTEILATFCYARIADYLDTDCRTKLGVDEDEHDLPQQAVEAHVTDEPGAAEPEEHANRGDERLANTLTVLPFTSDLCLAAPACVRLYNRRSVMYRVYTER